MARQYSEVPKQLVEQGVADGEGFLSPAAYDLVTAHVPIICVDLIPVNDNNRLGTITRATGPEAGKLAMLGGRIQKDETISGAIGRHLLGSLGRPEFVYHRGNVESHPFYVAQYTHAPSASEGFDPTKHAIAMTYLIDIKKPDRVQDEASDFRWIGFDEIPEESAYNHHIALLAAAKFLTQLP